MIIYCELTAIKFSIFVVALLMTLSWVEQEVQRTDEKGRETEDVKQHKNWPEHNNWYNKITSSLSLIYFNCTAIKLNEP